MTETKWKVVLYQTERGKKPVQRFLDEVLEEQGEADTLKITNKFELLEELGFQGAVGSELVGKVRDTRKIWRLKVWDTPYRVCFFLWRHPTGQRCMMMASAEIKKGDRLDPQTIQRAVEARDDWFSRHD